ncbi:MAG: hypothetical protein U0264_12040 [Candidatus Kapaibacterium sp.]
MKHTNNLWGKLLFKLILCIFIMLECSCSFSSDRNVFNSILGKLNKKYNTNIEEKLANLDSKNQDYIHISLISSSGVIHKEISYIIYMVNGRYLCQKITSIGVYEPDTVPLDFSKYMALIENKSSYSFENDTSIKALDSHFTYYSILVRKNRIKRNYKLLEGQFFDSPNVPGCQLLREFVMDTHWIEMRKSRVFEQEF